MSNVTPMMKQYLSIKAQHQDALLFLDLVIFMRCFMTMRLRRLVCLKLH